MFLLKEQYILTSVCQMDISSLFAACVSSWLSFLNLSFSLHHLSAVCWAYILFCHKVDHRRWPVLFSKVPPSIGQYLRLLSEISNLTFHGRVDTASYAWVTFCKVPWNWVHGWSTMHARGYSWNPNFQHTIMWLAAAWLPCCLCYSPPVSLYRVHSHKAKCGVCLNNVIISVLVFLLFRIA
jgi:hypothetical protein